MTENGIGNKVADMLDKMLPFYFFKNNPTTVHRKAPRNVALIFLFLQIIIVLACFGIFIWYFHSLTTTETVVSNKLKGGDYTCNVLSPLTGTYYGNGLGALNSSQNGQFSGSTLNYDECVQYLEAYDLCDSTYDYISVIGVDSFNDIDFPVVFHSGSVLLSTYYKSVLEVQVGKSSSFTRPTIPSTNYTNPSNTLYYYVHQSYAYEGKSILNVNQNFVIDGSNDYTWRIINTYLQKDYPQNEKPSVIYDNYVYTDFMYQFAINNNTLFGFNLTKLDAVDHTTCPVLKGNGDLIKISINDGNSTLWDQSHKYCDLNANVSKLIYNYESNRYYGACDVYIYTDSQSCTAYTTSLFWINPNILNSIYTIELNQKIDSVSSKKFYFVNDTTLYIENKYKINLNNGYVTIPTKAPFSSYDKSYKSISDLNIIYFKVSGDNGVNSNSYYVYNTTSDEYNEVQYYYSTYYMLSYSYGICNNEVTNVFINVSTDMSYDVYCKENNGFYYQAPNSWYKTPMQCATMQPSELLTTCPEVIDNMNKLKSNTCKNSIHKLCDATYTLNPPFSCEHDVHLTILQILANAFSTTNAVRLIITVLSSIVLVNMYKNYSPFYQSDDYNNEINNLKNENEILQKKVDIMIYHLQKDPTFNYKNQQISVIRTTSIFSTIPTYQPKAVIDFVEDYEQSYNHHNENNNDNNNDNIPINIINENITMEENPMIKL